ncbi:MAG: cytidylate kinase-like family protein [Lachnospiraceae bacterium]|nr:cytidylate kinase-like family protein [Lachnospiraceae bacterium]
MDRIVTISRQYGSGGREIGRKLAEVWGIPFYDNELITRAAKDSGFAETAFETAESRANNSLLYSIARGTASFNGQDVGFSVDNLSLDDKLYLAQAKVIRNCAAEGPCVIVGRCADYILRKLDNLVNIFVYADMDFRIERAMRIDGMAPEKIENAILKIDKRRSNYHNFHTGEKWGKVENYSLCINSARVGIDNAVQVIKTYVEGMK